MKALILIALIAFGAGSAVGFSGGNYFTKAGAYAKGQWDARAECTAAAEAAKAEAAQRDATAAREAQAIAERDAKLNQGAAEAAEKRAKEFEIALHKRAKADRDACRLSDPDVLWLRDDSKQAGSAPPAPPARPRGLGTSRVSRAAGR